MSGLKLQRLGLIMEPEPGNPQEIEGVLNPAAARGPDGKLYLFPRLVAKGNYSRIGIARVLFNDDGDPTGVSGWASRWSRKPTMSCGPTAAAAAKSPGHLCGTDRSLPDDLRGIFSPRPTNCPRSLRPKCF